MSLQKLIDVIRTAVKVSETEVVDVAGYAGELFNLCEAAEVLAKELRYLGFERPSCTGYGCCAKCGEIYSAEEALDKADAICGDENGKG